MLKRVKITDTQLLIHVAVVVSLVVAYLTVLVLIFPIEIKEKIVNSERMQRCEWGHSAKTAYRLLFVVELLALFLIARLSWSLRTMNEVYNEVQPLST